MKQNIKKISSVIMLIAILVMCYGVCQQPNPSYPNMQKQQGIPQDNGKDSSTLAIQIGSILNDTSAKTAMLVNRGVNKSMLRGQMRIYFGVLDIIQKTALLFSVFYFLVLVLNISGFYSKSMQILIYIHQIDGKKKHPLYIS